MLDSGNTALLIRTKLAPGRAPRGVIERPRLAASQHRVVDARLTTITAPGGYGKSTLASLWLASWQGQGIRTSWLGLDAEDNEPTRFVFYLCHALQQLEPAVGQAALALLYGSTLVSPRALLSMVINDLGTIGDESILVIDDAHVIESDEVLDLLSFLISHAPDSLHLMILSRTRPALQVGRLRARGDWVEIDAAQLRFDPHETRRFLESADDGPVSAAQVECLQARTEGWPAAVRIAAHRRLTAPDRDAFDDWTASSREIGLLIEEVVGELSDETLRFLVAVAVPDRIDEALCVAVSGRQDAAELFRKIRTEGVLVEALGDDGRTLRFHQLLRDHLLGPLCTRLAIDLKPIHLSAAMEFAARRQWTEAVRHALAANETERAVQWLAQCAITVIQQGEVLPLLGWAQQFPPELMQNQAGIQLSLAWGFALAMQFEKAEPLLQAFELRATTHPKPEMRAVLRAHATVVRAVMAATMDDEQGAQAWMDAWAGPALVDRWAANCASSVGRWLNWKAGDWAAMYLQPWQRAESDDDHRDLFTGVYRAWLLGSAELDQGRLSVADMHVEEGLRLTRLCGRAHSVKESIITPLLAALAYERGEVQDLGDRLQRLLPLVESAVMLDGLEQTYLVLARLARLECTSAAAFVWLDRAEAIGTTRRWDRLVCASLFQRVVWLAEDGRQEEAVACLARLRIISARHQPPTRCARSDIRARFDWASAVLDLHAGRYESSIAILMRLRGDAGRSGFRLRALQLGSMLASAQALAGERRDADRTLAEVLQFASDTGIRRSVLDFAIQAPELLQRFTTSRLCTQPLKAVANALIMTARDSVKPRHAAGIRLTERECDVLTLVASGLSNKRVARELGLSAETVKTHLAKIFTKLDVQDRVDAVTRALVAGLINPPDRS